MRDDFLSGDWAASQHRFSVNIDKLSRDLIGRIGDTFDALHRVQFDAPWQRPARRTRIGGLR